MARRPHPGPIFYGPNRTLRPVQYSDFLADPPPAASGTGQQTGDRLKIDDLLDIINEVKSMRKYLKTDTEIAQIETIIIELETMLKYAHT